MPRGRVHRTGGPPSGHVLSRFVSAAMPSRLGPRHCGQSAGSATADVRKTAVTQCQVIPKTRHETSRGPNSRVDKGVGCMFTELSCATDQRYPTTPCAKTATEAAIAATRAKACLRRRTGSAPGFVRISPGESLGQAKSDTFGEQQRNTDPRQNRSRDTCGRKRECGRRSPGAGPSGPPSLQPLWM